MGLDTLLAKIESDARGEAARIQAEAAEQARKILGAAESRGRALSEEILASAGAAAEEQKKRMVTLAALDARRRVLEAKQRLIAQAFEEAGARLARMPDADYRPLIKKMLLGAVRSGNEEVVVSEKDRGRITPPFIAEVNRELAASGKNGNLRLSSTTREMLGGFILVEGNIENNNSFDVALRLMRDDLEPRVASILFAGSAGPEG